MQPTVSPSKPAKSQSVYVSLSVRDGDRLLKPAQVLFDRLIFDHPPHLTSSEVEVTVANGDVVDRRVVAVLPHDPSATEIPIRLLKS
ncbi:MAG TPA: hypothetical protein VH370_12475 [Humisphaera sp.]|jgi:hypothetical protein|nr:hypothetical protein [Humisphaera sp.]